jgi:hypothetical protein
MAAPAWLHAKTGDAPKGGETGRKQYASFPTPVMVTPARLHAKAGDTKKGRTPKKVSRWLLGRRDGDTGLAPCRDRWLTKGTFRAVARGRTETPTSLTPQAWSQRHPGRIRPGCGGATTTGFQRQCWGPGHCNLVEPLVGLHTISCKLEHCAPVCNLRETYAPLTS